MNEFLLFKGSTTAGTFRFSNEFAGLYTKRADCYLEPDHEQYRTDPSVIVLVKEVGGVAACYNGDTYESYKRPATMIVVSIPPAVTYEIQLHRDYDYNGTFCAYEKLVIKWDTMAREILERFISTRDYNQLIAEYTELQKIRTEFERTKGRIDSMYP